MEVNAFHWAMEVLIFIFLIRLVAKQMQEKKVLTSATEDLLQAVAGLRKRVQLLEEHNRNVIDS